MSMNVVGKRGRRAAPVLLMDALEGRMLLSHGPTPGPQHAPAALMQAHRPSPHAGGEIAPATARWSWLADTYWYVPAPNTPAVLFQSSDQTLVPTLDQTVYHITGYRNGYFWGVTVTQLGPLPPVSSSLIGSVTPEGRVLLNFTPMNGSTDPTATEGIGRMRPKHGQWTMENQTFSPSGSALQLGHWAYMVPTRPGLPSWQSLPVVGVSVPQFLSNAQGAEPQPIIR